MGHRKGLSKQVWCGWKMRRLEYDQSGKVEARGNVIVAEVAMRKAKRGGDTETLSKPQ